MMTRLKRLCLALMAVVPLMAPAQEWSFKKINPKATYLRDSQFAPAASAIDLGILEEEWLQIRSSGLFPTLEIRTVGWFNRATDNPLSMNISNEAVAAFSATEELDADWTRQFRIASASDAGEDFYTLPTWVGHQPTDIPEDFGIGALGVLVPVPDGARYLMLTPFDNGFWNNADDFSVAGADPRGFGVEWRLLQPVPEPASALALAAGVWAAMRRRARKGV